MFTTSTRCSKGTNLKLIACTAGQSIQLLLSAGQYAASSFSFGSEPSIIAMLLKKQKIFVPAKIVWSGRTRAAIVRFGRPGKLILRARKANHVVAAGPNTAVKRRGPSAIANHSLWKYSASNWNSSHIPPPYRAIRPVRARLCFSIPTFSTPCCAMTSPVAKST